MEKNYLISAYVEGWEPYQSTRNEYIKNTTLCSSFEGIKDLLLDYIHKFAEDDYIKNLLNSFLEDKELLKKVHVVCDGSYRNVVWIIRPDRMDCFDIEKLDYYKKNAETIFLILDSQPSEDRKLLDDLLFEMLIEEQDLYDYPDDNYEDYYEDYYDDKY